MKPLRYIDLPLHERAAFELVCARRGFAPTHFDITGFAQFVDGSTERLVTIHRGSWTQSYRAGGAGTWVREFERDLVFNLFK